jgi:DNA-binding transcriptional regulator YhcF (GntR family)
MTRDHDPFTQAFVSLRARIARNDYGAGQPIVIVEEARRLKISVTPVREALSRLGGEGLVERAASGGYFAPRFDAAIVSDRYRFRLTCLLAALDLITSSASVNASTPPGAGFTFDQIISRSGSPSLADAYNRANTLLSGFVSVEGVVVPDPEVEDADLRRRYMDPDRVGLAEALTRYHRRRMDRAADLVTAMQDRGAPRLGDPAS